MAMTSVSAASIVRSSNALPLHTTNRSSSKLVSFSFSSLRLPVELRQVRLANGGVLSQSRSRISPLVAAKKQTFPTFDELLTNSDKPVFVEFYATWCGPCKFMNPILDEVGITLKDTVQLVKIDTEKYPSIANKYQIEALPTFILFKEGKPCDRFEGALTKDHLIERIENLLNVKQ